MDPRADETVQELAGQLEIVTAQDAARRGLDGGDLRDAHGAGRLVRVRRGAYTSAEGWALADAAEHHRIRVLAAARRLVRPVFSHDSAAALWRLPRIGPWPTAVHVSVARAAGGRSSRGVRRHQALESPEHLVLLDGVRATGAARTVVDVARTWSFPAALAAADHALRLGWTTPARLSDELAEAGRGRGVRLGRRVVELADGASESVGESLSRARMADLGLPAPVLQHVVEDGSGVVGRVDFWWEHLGLVGEFDGRVKYRTAGVADGCPVEDRLWAEKAREDRLRAAGLRIVRWTWDVAMDPVRLASRLAAAGLVP